MATFLQLCQDVARESGTISGTLPTTVVGQTGRLAKIVTWTSTAWKDIQNHRNAWLWMRKEFSGVTIAETARYTPSAWDIDDLANWIVDADATSLYLQSSGVSDEGPIRYIPWPAWKARYGRGAQIPNRPTEYTVTPSGEFALGSIPDAAYVVNGEYVMAPQILKNNADVPELPVRFHDIITYKALMLLAGHDEAPTTYADAMSNFNRLMTDLERDQLPQWSMGGGPLA